MTSASIESEQPSSQNAAAALYVGKVLHVRLRPKQHRFTYRLFMMLLDLDRLDAAGRMSSYFSVGRFNLLSFHERDHLPSPLAPPASLVERARALFAERGIDVEACRIMLLCLPRVFGYAFNPISVFYAIDESEAPRGLIYEVRNTFGGRHTYVSAGGELDVIQRHALKKQFHVSPFLPMDLEYRFSVALPGETVTFRILEHDAEGPILSTGFAGTLRNLSNPTALGAFFRLPMVTVKVILAIHFEAIRLYMKGLRVYPNPERGR
jgi:DUF1365 family protein